MELAGTLARELQELKADLTTDTEELKETEEAYQNNLRQAKVVQREFEDKVRRLEKQLSQVQIKEAQAEAAAALGNTAFKVGDLGDTLKDVEGVLEKRYEVSAGKARVAKDMVNMAEIQEKEGERKALEQNALAEFLASQGVQAPASATGTRGHREADRADLSTTDPTPNPAPVTELRSRSAVDGRSEQQPLEQTLSLPARPAHLAGARRRPRRRSAPTWSATASRRRAAAGTGSPGGTGSSGGDAGEAPAVVDFKAEVPRLAAGGAVHDEGQHRPHRDQRVRRLRRAHRRQRRPRADRELACSSRTAASRSS